MNTEPALSQPMADGDLHPPPFPGARWGKVLYGSFLIFIPILAFGATEIFKPEWQNGELNSYIILLLFPKASLLFFPLLLYSVVCYIFLLSAPDRYSFQFAVRLGIYLGVLLALQYTILSGFFLLNNGSFSLIFIFIWGLPIVVSKVYPWSVAKWGARKVIASLLILVFVTFVLLIAKTFTLWAPPLMLLTGLTVAAPFWSFLIFLRAAVWLLKDHETRLNFSRGVGIAVWFTVYVAAWRYDILKMYELYAALPAQPPPDCYIATAAARGHPKLVGLRTVRCTDGKSVRVNGQLQILKCAELALLAVNPRLHATLRGVYDVVGKFLARRIQNPFVADVAYILLKPYEWCAILVLKFLIPEVRLFSRRMYISDR